MNNDTYDKYNAHVSCKPKKYTCRDLYNDVYRHTVKHMQITRGFQPDKTNIHGFGYGGYSALDAPKKEDSFFDTTSIPSIQLALNSIYPGMEIKNNFYTKLLDPYSITHS